MEQNKTIKTGTKENILGTEKVSKLLVSFAVPGIISMLVNSVYNIVDQIFIGQGVGYLGNGATNVIFPMSTLALAFAMMIGNGAGSYMSLMLGRKREDDAAKGVAAGVIGLIGVGVVLMAAYLIFMEPLCILFGATDAIMPYALDYGRIISLGLPLFAFAAGFSAVVRSDGSPRWNMAGLMAGCIINIILDPIFIFVLHMGVKGAALATILGQFVNAVIVLLYIPRMKTVRLNRNAFSGWRKAFPSVVSLGTSSFFSQFVTVISIAVQNNVLVRYGAMSEYGAEIPMTALGVTMKIFSILVAIIVGLVTGAQPILGYNYGAGKYDRVKTTFRYIMISCVISMCVATVIFQIFPRPIVSIFGTDSELYVQFSIRCLKIFLVGIPLGAAVIISGNFFQAVGKPVPATVLSLSKQILFMIPMSLLLPRFLGVDGVLWAGCFSDVLSFILCLLMFKIYWKKVFEEPAVPETVSAADAISYNGKGYLGDGQAAREDAPNVIVTIGRTYGSEGNSVGKALADMLGIPYYDGEILEKAAESTGLSRHYLEHVDESLRGTPLVYNVVPLRDANADAMESLWRTADEAQSEIILQAAQGPCVIIGRRADQVLWDRPNVVRAFVTAPLEDRIQTVCGSEHLDPDKARKKIEEIDRLRAEYYSSLNGSVWGQADNYDLCINTSVMGAEGAVQLLKNAVAGKLIHMQNMTDAS